MAAAFQQALCSNQLHGYRDSLSSCEELRNFAMITKLYSFGTSKTPLKKANCRYNRSKAFIVRASVSDSILSSLDSSGHDSLKMTDESALILLRHGESMWNERNLFTGCVDVPLTNKGVIEAIEAGKRIRNIPIDIIYTSALVRSQMTAMLALTQHCCEKVPIFMHNETEQATLWSQINSEDTKKESIPVIKAWQLNERMYGDLQGLNKQETAERFGKEQVYKWRRSYYVRPPNGESLEMCLERAVSYFKEQVEPQLLAGRHLMVVAHANSLRSIIMYLDKLTPQEVIDLELSTGVPMLYIYKNGEFTRRGSPPAPSEAGIYNYTWVLICQISFHEILKQMMSSKACEEIGTNLTLASNSLDGRSSKYVEANQSLGSGNSKKTELNGSIHGQFELPGNISTLLVTLVHF